VTGIEFDLAVRARDNQRCQRKKALYRAIVKNLRVLGIPADQVKVLLREAPRENWGIRGGVPASEADIGFEING
jgi:phenylpyruvate tautomerase PptA (4-oxalocrotonate tautomerase family)